MWESLHRFDVCKSTVLRSAIWKIICEVSTTWPKTVRHPRTASLPSIHRMTWWALVWGFFPPQLCSLLQLEDLLRFGGTVPGSSL
jgi:hypothetical protein